MSVLFYISGAIAIIAAVMVIVQANAMRALISLVVLLLAVASVFYTLGGPFIAVLQIIIYAGAIIVLFVFVVMILNLGREAILREKRWLGSVFWILPVILAIVLLVQFIVTLTAHETAYGTLLVTPKAVGISLFTTYLIGVELASILLLAALVAAFHFGLLPMLREEQDE